MCVSQGAGFRRCRPSAVCEMQNMRSYHFYALTAMRSMTYDAGHCKLTTYSQRGAARRPRRCCCWRSSIGVAVGVYSDRTSAPEYRTHTWSMRACHPSSKPPYVHHLNAQSAPYIHPHPRPTIITLNHLLSTPYRLGNYSSCAAAVALRVPTPRGVPHRALLGEGRDEGVHEVIQARHPLRAQVVEVFHLLTRLLERGCDA